MSNTPSPPWTLRCPWCAWECLVFARGSRGADQGSGVEAARLGQEHAERAHGRTWADFLTGKTVSA